MDVYRQRVSRARLTLEAFTLSFCGLVNDAAPCSWPRRVAKAQALGRLQRDKLPMDRRSTAFTQATHEMESLHATARLLRTHSQDPAPEELLELIRATLDKGDLRVL